MMDEFAPGELFAKFYPSGRTFRGEDYNNFPEEWTSRQTGEDWLRMRIVLPCPCGLQYVREPWRVYSEDGIKGVVSLPYPERHEERERRRGE